MKKMNQEGNGPLDSDESMITDIKYGLIFEIISFNYPDIHGHLVSNRDPNRLWLPPNSLSEFGGQI